MACMMRPQTQAAYQPQQQTAPQTVVPPEPDAYDRYGISKVHPDGRAKTKAELNRELRAKLLEEKRIDPFAQTDRPKAAGEGAS